MEALAGALVALVFLGLLLFVRALQGVYDARRHERRERVRDEQAAASRAQYDAAERAREAREAELLAPWRETVERCQS